MAILATILTGISAKVVVERGVSPNVCVIVAGIREILANSMPEEVVFAGTWLRPVAKVYFS